MAELIHTAKQINISAFSQSAQHYSCQSSENLIYSTSFKETTECPASIEGLGTNIIAIIRKTNGPEIAITATVWSSIQQNRYFSGTSNSQQKDKFDLIFATLLLYTQSDGKKLLFMLSNTNPPSAMLQDHLAFEHFIVSLNMDKNLKRVSRE